MSKMNWPRVNRENLEMRHGFVPVSEMDAGLVGPSHPPQENRQGKRPMGKQPPNYRAIPKVAPQTQRTARNPALPLLAALQCVAQSGLQDIVGWSEAELKHARAVCKSAAFFFDVQLKPKSDPVRVPPLNGKKSTLAKVNSAGPVSLSVKVPVSKAT